MKERRALLGTTLGTEAWPKQCPRIEGHHGTAPDTEGVASSLIHEIGSQRGSIFIAKGPKQNIIMGFIHVMGFHRTKSLSRCMFMQKWCAFEVPQCMGLCFGQADAVRLLVSQ